LTHWMRRRGLLHPILVRPLARDEFEVVAGERRLIAAHGLGWLEIECRVRSYPDPAGEREPLGDIYALEDALIENLVRENLGKLEESEAILDLVCLHIGAARGFVMERLGAMRYRARKGHNVVTLLEEDEQILAVFAALNLIGWQAFYTHRLPLLELPDDVKGLIQARTVNYAVAKRIAKLEKREKARIIERIQAGLRGHDLKRELDGVQHKPAKPEAWNRLERIRIALTDKALNQTVSELLTSLERELGLA
jgi:ParB family transcriptional regulator, chromosome partitioning protein